VRGPLALALLAAPALAAACPYCARDLPPAVVALVGGLVAAPYLVALAVWRSVRHADDEEGGR
jgi:hypothetical protein